MASVMVSDGETEEDVSADLTSVLSEEFTKLDELLTQTQLYSKKVRPKNPSSRRKEVVDAKERSSIRDLNNFLSNFNDQARIVESLSQKAKMADKKRIKAIGRVDVPQEAFMALKLEKEEELSCLQDWYVSSSHYRAKAPFMPFLTSDVVSLEAIQIINLPKDLEKDTIHCYNSNGFKLHRVPVPRPGKVLGLVGTNCIGKSTALQILAGKIKPNLGRYNCYEATTCGCYEKIAKGTLGMVLEKLEERGMMSEICDAMDLNHLLDREATQVSGGELQRFLIAAVCLKKPDIYVFNKPSNFLDVVLCGYVIVVEHDLSVLDYFRISFAVCTESRQLMVSDESLTFKVSDKTQESEGKVKSYARYKYPNMSKKLGNFKLDAKDQQVRVHQGQRAKACRIILLR
ncbi:hypothetical protein Bca101_076159 [Brassica carinata]